MYQACSAYDPTLPLTRNQQKILNSIDGTELIDYQRSANCSMAIAPLSGFLQAVIDYTKLSKDPSNAELAAVVAQRQTKPVKANARKPGHTRPKSGSRLMAPTKNAQMRNSMTQ